jgi:hypothetical protein
LKRQIIYPGAIPLETDLLGTNKNMMVALGKVISAVFGTTTFATGLACAPTAPASLNVSIGAGEVYSLQNIDGTAYSSVAADTAHQIMKQGIQLDAVQLACPAPATGGNSIAYLIQAAFSEVDGNAVVLPYYNASNPAQAYSGPAGAGTTNNTTRDGTVALSVKAGVSATTGSQVTPAPDAGYVGLWVVTVANGQTTIAAGNIAQYASAPFVGGAALLNVANNFTQPQRGPTPATGDRSTLFATTAMLLNEFGSSKAVSGFQRLPSGVIIQWGQGTTASSGVANVNFPIGFPSAALACVASEGNAGSWSSNFFTAYGTAALNPSGVNVVARVFNAGAVAGGTGFFNYIAIGW